MFFTSEQLLQIRTTFRINSQCCCCWGIPLCCCFFYHAMMTPSYVVYHSLSTSKNNWKHVFLPYHRLVACKHEAFFRKMCKTRISNEIKPLRKAHWICHGCEPDALAVELLRSQPCIVKICCQDFKRRFFNPSFLNSGFLLLCALCHDLLWQSDLHTWTAKLWPAEMNTNFYLSFYDWP